MYDATLCFHFDIRLVDATSLLNAIDGSGRDMRLPNIYLAPGQSVTLSLAKYGIVDATAVIVKNSAIASARFGNDNLDLCVTANGVGQTELTVVAPNRQTVIITVREGASDNGWL